MLQAPRPGEDGAPVRRGGRGRAASAAQVAALRALLGAAAYEFRMQVRRPALWLAVLLSCLAVVAMSHEPFGGNDGVTAAVAAGRWAVSLQALAPAAVGVLLADRLPRDRRLRVDELLAALPAPPGGLLLGKYLGATAASILPMVCVYAAGVAWLAGRLGAAAMPAAAFAFAAVNLPGLLFVAAFSTGCPAVLPVPVYQFLFVGYWFWGNWLSPSFRIPTISQTILTPTGKFAAEAFFRTHGHALHGLTHPIPAWQGAASVAVLLAGAAGALWVTWRYVAAGGTARGERVGIG